MRFVLVVTLNTKYGTETGVYGFSKDLPSDKCLDQCAEMYTQDLEIEIRDSAVGVNRLLSFWNRNQAHGEIVYKNGDKVIYDFIYVQDIEENLRSTKEE